MRAINKGTVPRNGGTPRIVADYKDWRSDLVDRLGNYCCYCNMRLNDSPQVEHVVPKKPQPGQPVGDRLAWENMLLACGPCNRTKDNNPVSISTHYLPDSHNTHLVFDYVIMAHPSRKGHYACIAKVKDSQNIDSAKAQETIRLCGLDSIVVNDRVTDLRWKYRYEAYLFARESKKDWVEWGNTIPDRYIPGLVRTVIAIGFFSIWLTVFEDVPEVIAAIVEGTPGNNDNCYDSETFDSIPWNLP